MAQVVLFGGSFDPPHIGHLEIIEALDSLYQKVVVVPAFCNPTKPPPIAPLARRIEWLQRLCAPYAQVEVSDFELRLGRVVYAIEWARFYAQGHTTLALGSDALSTLPLWRAASELARLVLVLPIVRAVRESNSLESPLRESCRDSSLHAPFASSQLHQGALDSALDAVREAGFSCCKPLGLLPCAISSSEIRYALARGESQKVARAIPSAIASDLGKIYYNAAEIPQAKR